MVIINNGGDYVVRAAVYGMRDSFRNESAGEDMLLGSIAMDHFLEAFRKLRESKRHCGTLPLSRIDLDWAEKQWFDGWHSAPVRQESPWMSANPIAEALGHILRSVFEGI